MIANCVNVEGRSLNMTNMNLLIRFNKTREIFPGVIKAYITIFSLCFIVVICRLMWALLQTANFPL